jgi:hypothetical protein
MPPEAGQGALPCSAFPLKAETKKKLSYMISKEATMNDKTDRGPNGKRRWLMDYIPDRQVFLAVMFARKMMRGRESRPMSLIPSPPSTTA